MDNMRPDRWIIVICGLWLLLATGLATTLWMYRSFAERPVVSASTIVEIPHGSNLQQVVMILTPADVAGKPLAWRLLARLKGVDTQLKAGEFELSQGMNPIDVLAHLRSGKVRSYEFRILEGWTLRQILFELESTTAVTSAGTQELKQFLARVSANKMSAEGWFYPETYRFVKGDTNVQILQRAHRKLQNELALAWEQRQTDIAIETAYEALILASVIEKETAIDVERRQVSGVFHRRIRKGMRLQTDPTVIYGLGESFDGNLTRRDLRKDGPYNTYTRKGLPPTPIASVRRESLLAAVQPQSGEALYFVADGQGGHVFSETIEEHNKAVKAYISRIRKL